MPRVLEQIADDCKQIALNDDSRDAVIEHLHGSGVDIVAAIKIYRRVFNVSLGDAKRDVSRHPRWRNEAAASETLHDAVDVVNSDNP